MKKSPLSGTGVALVTPFRNGAIHFGELERIIEFTIEGGVEYLLPLGSTGESNTISESEGIEVLRFTLQQAAGRVPVVAGFFGGNDTASLVRKLDRIDLSGVAAILSSAPAYNKPTQEGLFQHYMALAAASPLPIIIYNVPSRTACNIEPDTVLRLARADEKFIAVKEASGVVGQAMRIIKHRPEGFLVLSGDDLLTLPIIACGGDGVISVIANAFPGEFSNMVRAGLKEDFVTARKLNTLLWDLHKWMYIEGNPAGVKAAMEIRGLCSREVRLPLTSLTETNFEALKNAIHQIL
jgi:4-hydroxy-tetrahydrodipicolinate synthase